jgi:hypothetical protein
MSSIRKNERGFSAVESILVVVIVVAIVFVGWYVDKHRTKSTSKPVAVTNASQKSSGNQSSTPLPSGTSNSDLQSDLTNVTTTSNQSNQDISTSNSSLNDQSTMTTVPQ